MKAKHITITLLILVLALFGYLATRKQDVETIIETKVVEKDIGASLGVKIEELKQSLLDDLRIAEIKGYENRSLVIVFDPLKKDLEKCRQVGGVRLHCYSIGDFNFKIATVQHYYSLFFEETLTDKQAFEIAMDSKLSRELAYKIIFDEIGGIYAWRNSAKKINAVQRIEFIRNLEK